MARGTSKRKVRILCHLPEVYPKYQPEVGRVYDAEYRPCYRKGRASCTEVCVIDILDKRICLKKGEYEFVEDE